MYTERQQQGDKSVKSGISPTNIDNYCLHIKTVLRMNSKANRTKLKVQKETQEFM